MVGCAGPRYFGFVTGGATPTALAADWLTGTWDQNGALAATSPAAAAAEAVALGWCRELLGLPEQASGALVVGAQAANTLGVTIARDELLRRHDWDTLADGLAGGPPVQVVVGAERHTTVDRALRFAGLGEPAAVVDVGPDGAMDPRALDDAVATLDGPILVCAQVGNVNSGAFDPLGEIVSVARAADAWVHVDGAFGLWAAASETRDQLVDGADGADSWVADAHKWLNVPYDGALAFCAHAEAHLRTCAAQASYLPGDAGRDPMDWSQDASRRARGIVLYATLRALGRAGVSGLIDRCCDLAVDLGRRLDGREGLAVRNEIVLNQVVVSAGDRPRTDALIQAIQADGTCWVGPTTWRGEPAFRISVSNWSTTEADVERSAEAILGLAASI
ncbi:MAG: pyridoxal-dependent decarboxylase [Actinomycetota bacterium]